MQYKKRGLTKWIGEHVDHGFSWRSGKKHHMIGIWMWSEIFTHDSEKEAIILIDTQGIFDHVSSLNDCISIFAFSMLLSSVQLYNIMRDVHEDNLQHLNSFMQYAQLSMAESQVAPSQKLLFIVRDYLLTIFDEPVRVDQT